MTLVGTALNLGVNVKVYLRVLKWISFIKPQIWLFQNGNTGDLGPIFLSTARASSVSKLFIIWHSISDSKCTSGAINLFSFLSF